MQKGKTVVEGALQRAERRSKVKGKGEKERHTHLNADFQILAKRDKKTFLYFFALITEEGFLVSSCYSLELCIQMLISFLFSFAFHLSSFLRYL